jgi:hypothetical protein
MLRRILGRALPHRALLTIGVFGSPARGLWPDQDVRLERGSPSETGGDPSIGWCRNEGEERSADAAADGATIFLGGADRETTRKRSEIGPGTSRRQSEALVCPGEGASARSQSKRSSGTTERQRWPEGQVGTRARGSRQVGLTLSEVTVKCWKM